ncbi:MAG: Na+/H+ antiporter subunit E [Coxiellaceae bacterium]|nr:Na+/H+ antiporter subunit E [Coxiellaceae bacterium]
MKILFKGILAIQFILIFFYEVIIANFRVAYDVITPGFYAKPGVIAIPLDCKTDFEIMLLAIIISLTPGTLVLDISPDKKKLYIHAMFIDDKATLIHDVKNNFEMPLLKIME